jgi:hypothetical protein
VTNGKSVNQVAAGGPSPFSPDKHLTTTFVEFHSHIPNGPNENGPFPGLYTFHEISVTYRDGDTCVSNVVPFNVPEAEEPSFNY